MNTTFAPGHPKERSRQHLALLILSVMRKSQPHSLHTCGLLAACFSAHSCSADLANALKTRSASTRSACNAELYNHVTATGYEKKHNCRGRQSSNASSARAFGRKLQLTHPPGGNLGGGVIEIQGIGRPDEQLTETVSLQLNQRPALHTHHFMPTQSHAVQRTTFGWENSMGLCRAALVVEGATHPTSVDIALRK